MYPLYLPVFFSDIILCQPWIGLGWDGLGWAGAAGTHVNKEPHLATLIWMFEALLLHLEQVYTLLFAALLMCLVSTRYLASLATLW